MVSYVVLINIMPRLIQPIHLWFGVLLLLLPGGTLLCCLPTYLWSRIFTCPNHLSLTFLDLSLVFSTVSLSWCYHFSHGLFSVWPHTYVHIFISVNSHESFHWHCVHPVMDFDESRREKDPIGETVDVENQ